MDPAKGDRSTGIQQKLSQSCAGAIRIRPIAVRNITISSRSKIENGIAGHIREGPRLSSPERSDRNGGSRLPGSSREKRRNRHTADSNACKRKGRTRGPGVNTNSSHLDATIIYFKRECGKSNLMWISCDRVSRGGYRLPGRGSVGWRRIGLWRDIHEDIHMAAQQTLFQLVNVR